MDNRRAVLEVLKCCGVFDVTEACAWVSRLWVQATNSQEVWVALLHTYELKYIQGLTAPLAFLQQFSSPNLYFLQTNFLFSVNIQLKQWNKGCELPRRTSFGAMSSIVLYPPYLLVTGTISPITRQSALIHCSTGAIESLSDMNEAHYCHASVRYRNTGYVFAGFNDEERPAKVAEKMDSPF